ncbi:MAG: VOC family protein [Rhodococcus sp. (in: high G+C Gram-positive bacteria)]|nr:VOC family protein [Rhodococcus sp. (in: high G+C Gram-positive bacteria)]MDX5455184.1 VOC family protein [Rhodococcus sp. (in: high G+C Gram-positive bacteria)]
MSATRVQLALNVEDITAATEFYTALFGVSPHKQRPGYANFAIADPPLKLVLIENPGARERLNHLGIETDGPDEVSGALARFRAAGLTATIAEQDLCCHAVQDKVFVDAPDVPNGWWEYYAVTDDDPANPDGLTGSACAVACASEDSPTAGACCG